MRFRQKATHNLPFIYPPLTDSRKEFTTREKQVEKKDKDKKNETESKINEKIEGL